MGSSLNASLASAFAPVNRMKYIERDMAGFAASSELETAPGSAWNYHDGNTIILSRLIRDAAGGHTADVLRFARRELFEPFGMRNVTLEFDATGTPEGSSQMLAPARDWARFGLLYLDDGVVGGRRILPEGWVQYSASLTPNAWVGIGAGFWTNRGDSKGSRFRTSLGMATRCLLCQRHVRAICHHRAIRAARHCALRHFRKSIRHRRRLTARRRRHRRHQRQGARRRRKLDGALLPSQMRRGFDPIESFQ